MHERGIDMDSTLAGPSCTSTSDSTAILDNWDLDAFMEDPIFCREMVLSPPPATQNEHLSVPKTSSPPPVRRFKVKTGCVTCRIRKVKCDEAKPYCNRCTKTGRKCDGYAHLQKNRSVDIPNALQRSHSADVVPPALPTRPRAKTWSSSSLIESRPLPTAITDEERTWLDFFCRRTAPSISGTFDYAFWTQILPQLSFSEPAIRHALLAVGSYHARFELGTGSDLTSASSIANQNFSLEQYNKAISALQQRLTTNTDAVEVSLVCCLLFICLECMYGNRSLVLGHLGNGLKILNSARVKDGDLLCISKVVSFKQKLYQLFLRLDAQSTLIGKPVPPGVRLLKILGSRLDTMMPTAFGSFDEAKRTLDSLCGLSLGFVRSAYDSPKSRDVSRFKYQMRLQKQFLAWNRTFEALAQSFKTRGTGVNHTPDDRETLLRIQYACSNILLSTCLGTTEGAYDRFKSSFSAIVTWIKSLSVTALAPSSATKLASSAGPIFALDIGIIPALYLTAIKCRDPVLRREAASLLEAITGREGLWDARLHARVARRVIEVEEILGANQVPPEQFRVRMVDVVEEASGVEARCKVTLTTMPNSMYGEWMGWDEQLVL